MINNNIKKRDTMKNKLISILIASCVMSGTALASDDCTDPVADWQPKEHLRQMMIGSGWEVKRIKVDDGCYEIKGLDRNGHRVKAKFSPATLKIKEFEVKFDGSGDGSEYFNLGGQNGSEKSTNYLQSGNKALKNKPKSTIE